MRRRITWKPDPDVRPDFDCWVGHANFELPPEGGLEAARAVPGVERLDRLTRYRLAVLVGLAFDTVPTFRAVEAALDAPPGPYNPAGTELGPDVLARAAWAAQALAASSPHWALLVLPNGSLDAARSADPAGLAAAVTAYEEVCEAAGGVLHTSDD